MCSSEQAVGPEAATARAQVAAILESFPYACLAVDDEWRLTHVNHHARRLLQTPQSRQGMLDALVGTKVWDAFPPLRASSFARQCRRAQAQQIAVAFEAWFARPNKCLAVDAHPFQRGLLIYCRDITPYKHMEAKLKGAKVELDAKVEQQARRLLQLNAQLRAYRSWHKSLVERFTAQVRQQTALAQLSQRALAGLDLRTLMDEAVACLAQMLRVEAREARALLVDSGGVEVDAAHHSTQSRDGRTRQHRRFIGEDANFLRAVANILDLTIERQHAQWQTRQAEDRWRGALSHLEALAGRVREVHEHERQRLAREMHDDLGHRITGLQLDAAWLIKGLRRSPSAWRQRLEAMAAQLDDLLDAVHRLGTELRPGILDDLGLQAAIESYLHEARRRTGLAYEVSFPPEGIRLDPARALTVFRIFQEALTNVLRHAKASRVTVRTRQHLDAFYLEVSDNGRGIKPAQITASASLGLLGMRERAQLWDGEVTIQSRPGESTTIAVRIPYGGLGEVHTVDDPSCHRR
jgi:signal transduction histidine kinase